MSENEQRDTDPLLHPGAGLSPSHGINEGNGNYPEPITRIRARKSNLASIRLGSERIWSVAVFSLIACMASFLVGMMLGYSSLTILELNYIYSHGNCSGPNDTVGIMYGIKKGSIHESLFGVSGHQGAI